MSPVLPYLHCHPTISLRSSMMNFWVHPLVVFLLCFFFANAKVNNNTYLIVDCKNGGCDFEFIIDKMAVDTEGMDEINSIVHDINATLFPVNKGPLGRAIIDLQSEMKVATLELCSYKTKGKLSACPAMAKLDAWDTDVDKKMAPLPSAAQDIWNAARCFQRNDPNENCGAIIPDSLSKVDDRGGRENGDCSYCSYCSSDCDGLLPEK